MKFCPKVLSCLLATCLAGTSFAQDVQPVDENWYAVEVIAFKRLQINQNERPLDIERLSLSYPKDSMSIINADTVAAMYEQTKELASASRNPALSEEQNPNTQISFNEPPADEQSTVDLQTRQELAANHFVVSNARAEHGLSAQAGSLARSKNQRVLFHQRWNLHLPPQQKHYNVVIHGGEQFGENQELEGYIQLSRSRYLHVESNLWLSQFGLANEGDFGRWIGLPKRPSAFRDIPIKRSQDLIFKDADSSTLGSDSLDITSLHTARQQNQQQKLDSGYTDEGDIANSTASQFKQTLPAQSQYVLRSIEQLQQKRRMRSGEMHYIDHPAFGMIIQLTPIDAPQWPFDNSLLPELKDTQDQTGQDGSLDTQANNIETTKTKAP